MFSKILQSISIRILSAIPQRPLSSKIPNDLSLMITKGDVEETLDFISYSFIRDEPIVQASGIVDTCDLQRYLKRQVASGYSLKLVDKECDVVAVALCQILTPKSSQETRTFAECSICDQKTKRLLNLWADIADSNNLFKCFNVDKVWDVSILATSELYRGRGLSKLLTQEAKILGKQKGMSIVRVDCTSFFSAKLVSSLKFVTLPPRHVLTFRDKKGCPWLPEAPPNPHGHIIVAYDFLV